MDQEHCLSQLKTSFNLSRKCSYSPLRLESKTQQTSLSQSSNDLSISLNFCLMRFPMMKKTRWPNKAWWPTALGSRAVQPCVERDQSAGGRQLSDWNAMRDVETWHSSQFFSRFKNDLRIYYSMWSLLDGRTAEKGLGQKSRSVDDFKQMSITCCTVII